MVYKDGFLEKMDIGVTSSAANTYTEQSYACPVSKNENIAMLIWGIALDHLAPTDSPPVHGERVDVALHGSSQTAILELGHPECIHKFVIRWNMATSGAAFNIFPYFVWFPKPILYARATIYFAINTVNLTAAIAADGAIYYQVEKVDKDDYIDALVQG